MQETHVALPGPGTIRRWRREAPEGFSFALLGPREVGQEGFRDGKVIETALKSSRASPRSSRPRPPSSSLRPSSLRPARTRRAVQEFLASVQKQVRARHLRAAARLGRRRVRRARRRTSGAIAARDPLRTASRSCRSPTTACRARPGTSRATRIRPSSGSPRSPSRAKHKDATYVFTNVDMFADAKRFKKAMKL